MSSQQFVLGAAFVLAVALMGVPGARPSQASADAYTLSFTIPVSPPTFEIPCTGDIVTLSGDLHVVDHMTIDANGGIHVVWSVNPQGVAGTDSSGNTYRGVGCTRYSDYAAPDGLPFVATYVDNFGLIGAGLAPNLFLKTLNRITIDANGNVSNYILVQEVRCQ